MVKAIETVYNGYRFRSRLEARWAVFFATLGIKYEYEKEGYDLDGVWYLPDFWIALWNSWVEIKPEYPTEQEIDKCRRLSHATGKDCIVIWGEPWAALHHRVDVWDEYWDYRYRAAYTHPGRYLSKTMKDLSQEERKLWNASFEGDTNDDDLPVDPDDFDIEHSYIFTECRRCPAINWLIVGNGGNCSTPDDGREIKPILGSDFCGFGSLGSCCGTDKWPVADVDCLPRLKAAYKAARQARFEAR